MTFCSRLHTAVLILTAMALPASAETSSWVQREPAGSVTGGKPVVAPKSSRSARAGEEKPPTRPAAPLKAAPKTAPAPGTETGQARGAEAAYLAFDAGRFLTALALAQDAANAGDPPAHTLVGRIYAEGLGVKKDEALAAKWYTRGAELGDVNAMFAIGLLLAEGRGVDKNAESAAAMFEQAALTGHPQANYNLGLMFLNGKGKPENPRRAFQHIEYAARQGVAPAQYDVSAFYQQGVGTDADAWEAARWMKAAAEQGMAVAEYEYAVMLLKGFGLKEDEFKAIQMMRSAAEKGVPGAQNRLAHIYREGLGVAPDPAEMARWRIIARTGGIEDTALDGEVAKLPEKDREAAEAAAEKWIDRAQVNALVP
ncbi:MAG: tetratricopeptide repeat protein [Hyphomicrobiaceae bacterium]|nr:tetratricopeptide repeat protein [Hyphomicrobiaceae bacterium]